MCKKTDQLLCHFVWKNKTRYVKKYVLPSNSFSNGGLNFVDFATLNKCFWNEQGLGITWEIHPVFWNIIPEYVFSQLGGLNCLLMYNLSIEKIPVGLSNFQKQALLD